MPSLQRIAPAWPSNSLGLLLASDIRVAWAEMGIWSWNCWGINRRWTGLRDASWACWPKVRTCWGKEGGKLAHPVMPPGPEPTPCEAPVRAWVLFSTLLSLYSYLFTQQHTHLSFSDALMAAQGNFLQQSSHFYSPNFISNSPGSNPTIWPFWPKAALLSVTIPEPMGQSFTVCQTLS